MRLPSKVFSYGESALAKFPLLLGTLQESPMIARQLYESTRRYWDGIGTYIETLDYLYALGKVRFDDTKEKLLYVG